MLRHLRTTPTYRDAACLFLFLGVKSEVETQPWLPALWGDGKRIVIPYCVGDRLHTFEVRDEAELEPGAYGIPEPSSRWREDPGRQVSVSEFDLVLVPGVAFDRTGGRLGQGGGYYDRFLSQPDLDAECWGVAFTTQIVEQVPMEPHDLRVDVILTEDGLLRTSENADGRDRP